MQEHEIEPVPGLPERLPEREAMLWQGKPNWRTLFLRSFPTRWLALYFAVLIAWQVAEGGVSVATLGGSLGLAAAALGLVALYAWFVARGSVYTITSRRVVMRVGVALPITINLPFAVLQAADLRSRADGSGDVVLTVQPGTRVSWLALWPHARPWRLSRPQPMLRGLAQAGAAAQVLARALAAHAERPVPTMPERAGPAGAVHATGQAAAAA